MSKITIVNQADEIIGYKTRGTLSEADFYRVAALWLTNSRGEILIAKRHHLKATHPGKWGPAVAGTVEEGETYETNIIKEAEEEIGLKNIKPTLGPKITILGSQPHFTQWYTLVLDREISEFKLQTSEVAAVKWISPEDLRTELQENPAEYLPRLEQYRQLFS